MTIDFKLATVADAISNLSISGVTIRDIDAIPTDATGAAPILFPRPNDYITDIEFARVSQGGAGTALMDVSYSLHYVYCHAPINSGMGTTIGVYSALMANMSLILEAIFTNDNIAGAVDMQIESIGSVGVVNDPVGKTYHGLEFTLRVTEFAQ